MTEPSQQLRDAAHRLTHPDQPVTIPQPSRPAMIAALHGGAAFMAQEHNLPMPNSMVITAREVPYDRLVMLAHAYGVPMRTGGRHAWITIPVAVEALTGVEIEYVAFAAMGWDDPAGSELPSRSAGITFDDYDRRQHAGDL